MLNLFLEHWEIKKKLRMIGIAYKQFPKHYSILKFLFFVLCNEKRYCKFQSISMHLLYFFVGLRPLRPWLWWLWKPLINGNHKTECIFRFVGHFSTKDTTSLLNFICFWNINWKKSGIYAKRNFILNIKTFDSCIDFFLKCNIN